MKSSGETIGNQTRDLPACSAVPQSNALPRAPKLSVNIASKYLNFDTFSNDSLVVLCYFLLHSARRTKHMLSFLSIFFQNSFLTK
jgi:hypothetical protein